MLLLIGAVNLTNLLLIRANSRMKEMAVRQALGASRLHVVSEVVVETTLLTLAGGLARARGRRRRNPPAGCAGRRSPAPGKSHCLRCPTGMGRRARALSCMGLLLAVPIAWFNLRGRRSERDPIGDSRRNVQPGGATLATWLHRGADRAGAGPAGRGGSAGAQSGTGDGSFPGLPAGSRSHRPDLRALEQIPELAGSPGVQRKAVERASPASREFRPPASSTMCL